jgi:hypothetical protein
LQLIIRIKSPDGSVLEVIPDSYPVALDVDQMSQPRVPQGVKAELPGAAYDDPYVWIRNYGRAAVYHRSKTCGKVPAKKHTKMRLSRAIAAACRPCSWCGDKTAGEEIYAAA